MDILRNGLRLSQVAFPVVAGVIIGLGAHQVYPIGFFEATVQVIPIPLLALVIDLRASGRFPPSS